MRKISYVAYWKEELEQLIHFLIANNYSQTEIDRLNGIYEDIYGTRLV